MKGLLRCIAVAIFAGVAMVAQAACVACCPLGDSTETLKTHACLSLCLGVRSTPAPHHVAYNGLTLGVAHASMPEFDPLRMFFDEKCDFNGVSVQVLSQLNVGTVRGLSVSGLIAAQRDVCGWQLSGLTNNAREIAGVQTSIGMNLADDVKGVQVGLLNVTKRLKGVQIGLLNINRAGWVFPLINVSF
jgi:hypothetical protein